MSRNYTHYWANKTCTDIEGSKVDEELLDHTAGNQFKLTPIVKTTKWDI